MGLTPCFARAQDYVPAHVFSTPAAASGVVLVVEDDFDVLNAIANILEEAGYEVLRAANGSRGVGQLGDRKGRCDLILLDLMMPVMNGWDFRRKQKRSPPSRESRWC